MYQLADQYGSNPCAPRFLILQSVSCETGWLPQQSLLNRVSSQTMIWSVKWHQWPILYMREFSKTWWEACLSTSWPPLPNHNQRCLTNLLRKRDLSIMREQVTCVLIFQIYRGEMGHNMEKGSKASKSTMDWTSVLDLFPGYSDIFRQVFFNANNQSGCLVSLRNEGKDLKPVSQTQARLTSGNGPLPLPERHYIALMVRVDLKQ